MSPEQIINIVTMMLALSREVRVNKILDFLGMNRRHIAAAGQTSAAMITYAAKDHPHHRSQPANKIIYGAIQKELAIQCPGFIPSYEQIFGTEKKGSKGVMGKKDVVNL